MKISSNRLVRGAACEARIQGVLLTRVSVSVTPPPALQVSVVAVHWYVSVETGPASWLKIPVELLPWQTNVGSLPVLQPEVVIVAWCVRSVARIVDTRVPW